MDEQVVEKNTLLISKFCYELRGVPNFVLDVRPFQRLTVRFVKLNPDAQEPVYGSAAAAGADLFSAEDCVVPAQGCPVVKFSVTGKMCVSTGLQVELPFGYYGRVAPRSGLAAKNFIDVGAGVVDSDYRGELKVLLFNFGSTDFEVKKGDRIAQLICERIAHCTFMQCESLTDTTRGAGGFGSTGK
ncbi:putative dUTP diphosphatase [Ancylostoma ceylanicum]|uniref:Deoxyuridine 5'-triphosphate nucleotidohydrolase n=2 Tax=Ancylostoma ceylanicum TaxID=53326 RepID=A0A0D6LCQ5_9BILA|nr:putative dUTP diphosphatase [Ancylostoma ceylanicum]